MKAKEEITKNFLTKEMEQIITIDGRGRPAKAKRFMELIDEFGLVPVYEEIVKFSERKAF